MMKQKNSARSVSHSSLKLLAFGLTLALLQLVLSVLELQYGDYQSKLYASTLFAELVEYVLLDILLVIIGAFLFDMVDRKSR